MQRAIMRKISPAARERIERTQFRPGNPADATAPATS